MLKRLAFAVSGLVLLFAVSGCSEKLDTSSNHAYAISLKKALAKADDETIMDYSVALQLGQEPTVKLTPEDMHGRTIAGVARLVRGRDRENYDRARAALKAVNDRTPNFGRSIKQVMLDGCDEILIRHEESMALPDKSGDSSADGDEDLSEDADSGDSYSL